MDNLLEGYDVESLRKKKESYKKKKETMLKKLDRAVRKLEKSKGSHFKIYASNDPKRFKIIEKKKKDKNFDDGLTKEYVLAWLKVRIHFLTNNDDREKEIQTVFYEDLIHKTHVELVNMCKDAKVSVLGSKSLLIFNLYFNIK